MDIVAEIENRLSASQLERATQDGQSFCVKPKNSGGFAVTLDLHDGEYTVAFDGWHEHFSDPDDALKCFFMGLGPKCRLKVLTRGSFPQKWTLEVLTGGKWVEDSAVGQLLFPFWRPKRFEYKRNSGA